METLGLLTLEGEWRLEGAIVARQRTLLRQLRLRFGRIPKVVRATVESTASMPQLEEWLDRVVTAPTLQDMGIDPRLGGWKGPEGILILRWLVDAMLRHKFGDIPWGVFLSIHGLEDTWRLKEWLERAETATRRSVAFRHPDVHRKARLAAQRKAEEQKRSKRGVAEPSQATPGTRREEVGIVPPSAKPKNRRR